MPLRMKCPACSALINVPDAAIGKQARCPKCREVFPVAVPTVSAADDHPPPDDGQKAPPRRPRGDDETPRTHPARKGSPVGMILGIVGGVCLLMCLGCVGVVGVYAWGVYDAFNQLVSQVPTTPQPPPPIPHNPDDHGERVTKPAGPAGGTTMPNVDPPRPPERLEVKDVDSALAAIKSGQRGPSWTGVEFFLTLPVDADRQAEVARALDGVADGDDGPGRQRAVKALEKWADKDSVPTLCRVLESKQLPGVDDTIGVRRAAIAALGRLKDERGAAPVAGYLEEVFLSEDAKKALAEMGPQVAEKAVLRYYHGDSATAFQRARELVKAWGTGQDAIIKQSLADAGSNNLGRRQLAIEYLANVTKPPEDLRSVAARLLEKLLTDPDLSLRQRACRALAVWADKDTVPVLIKIVEAPYEGPVPKDLMVRRHAVETLGRLKDDRVPPVVVAQLVVGPLHAEAEQAVLAQGTAAEKELRLALEGEHDKLREEALQILKRMKSTGNLELAKALGDLKSQNTNRFYRISGATWFAKQQAPDKERQAEAAAALVKCLESPDQPFRETAARALAIWATPDQVPFLVKALDEETDNVRAEAMRALAALKDERAFAALCKVVANDPKLKVIASNALKTIGPKAAGEVAELLKNPMSKVRVEACDLLKAMGTKETIPALKAAAEAAEKRKEFDVVRASKEAVEAIEKR